MLATKKNKNCSKTKLGISPILLIAHRGESYEAPENTLAAFNLAWLEGADGIECDVRLTKDGEMVCLHDENAKRTGGKDLAVSEATLAELRELEVGGWKEKHWAGVKIPTLAEVLATVPAGKKIYIEIKCGPEILPDLGKALAASRVKPAQVVIIAFSSEVIAEAKKKLPKIKALWLTDFKKDEGAGTTKPSAEEILAVLQETKADGVNCQAHPCVNGAFLEAFQAARKEVHVWTVDDVQVARRLLKLGVAALTSNRAGWLKRRLGVRRRG